MIRSPLRRLLARAELDIVRYSSNHIRNNRRYNKISSLPFSTAVTTSQIDWSQLLKSNNLLLSANQVERLLAILSATTIEIDCLFNNTVAMKTLDDLHSVLLQSQAGRIEAVRTTLMGEVEASAAVVQSKDLTAIANLLYQISVLDNENASELNERMRRHAFVLWTLLAMQGERNALYSLAQLMQAADGRQDLAEDLYRRAALQKHPHAMVPLHLALVMLVEKAAANGKNQENIGVYREALAWFEQALAAGVQQSLVNMANLYHYGHLCKQDSEKLTKASLEKAISLYQQAAGLGDPKALLALGNLYNSTDYHHHHNLNTTNDSTNDPNVWQRKAFDCWYQAARRAQPPANEPVDKMKYPLQQIDPQTASQALLRLGNMYFLGTAPNLSAGYPQQLRPDYECARELWELAADCDPKNIFAWLQLGNLHFDGMNKTVGSGRTRYERALNCYQRAVEEFINQNTNYQAMNWLQQRRQLAAMPLDEITGRLQLEQRAAVISNALLDRCYRLIGIKEGDANLVFPVMNRSASNAGKHQERGVTEIIQILKRSKLNDKSTSVNNEKPSANQISLSQSPFQSPTEPGDYVTDATDHNTQDIWLRKAESVYHDALLNRWRFVENRNDNDARDNSTSIAKEIDKRGCPIM